MELKDEMTWWCSSRRLEVSRLELLLQVGTFCAALGALVAGNDAFPLFLKISLKTATFLKVGTDSFQAQSLCFVR